DAAFPSSFILPPLQTKPSTFVNYVLGFRCEASDEELSLINNNNLLAQPFVVIRDGEAPITMAQALGPDWVAEVNTSQAELMKVEARIRFAAASWTRFLDSLATNS